MKPLFDRIGGYDTLNIVHKIFYDKVFEHSWLKHFFVERSQELLEIQQTKFMAGKMGTLNRYMGKAIQSTHQNMYVTEEIYELRSVLLDESIKEFGISDELRVEWMELNELFKNAIIKKSESNCTRAHSKQRVFIIPKPFQLK